MIDIIFLLVCGAVVAVALVLLRRSYRRLSYLRSRLEVLDEKTKKRNQNVSYAPTDALLQIANAERLRHIKDTDRYYTVREEIRNGTTRTPLLIVVDQSGKIALEDGHHRVLAAKELGYETLPVTFKDSKRISSHGKHVQTMLPMLLHRPKGA